LAKEPQYRAREEPTSPLQHQCEIVEIIGPYKNTDLLLFLEELHERLVPEVEKGQVGDHLPIYIPPFPCSHSMF